MIKSFHDKRSAALFMGHAVKGIDPSIQKRTRIRLLQIEAATCLDDLRNPPSNRPARKKGKLKHLHCLRVNSQWRICFEWKNGDAYAVRLMDYHQENNMLKRDQLSSTDFSAVTMGETMPPVHPGTHLLDYIEGAGISQYRLAKAIHVSPRRINEIVHGKRAITADTALRLARFFRTSPQFWMNLQSAWELAVTEEKIGAQLNNEIEPVAA